MAAGAGSLRELIGFYQPQAGDDGFGNVEAGYAADPDFVEAANVMPKLGGEDVLASRLAGTNLMLVTVRWSQRTSQITPAWRAKDERTSAIYNIRSIVNPDQKKHYLELLCEQGVAA